MRGKFPTFSVAEDGAVTGQLNGCAILRAIVLASGDAIVLREPEDSFFRRQDGRRSNNLSRLTAEGVIQWTASPPDNADYFTSFDFDGDNLVAASFSGWKSEIDVETGKTSRVIFTK